MAIAAIMAIMAIVAILAIVAIMAILAIMAIVAILAIDLHKWSTLDCPIKIIEDPNDLPTIRL